MNASHKFTINIFEQGGITHDPLIRLVLINNCLTFLIISCLTN